MIYLKKRLLAVTVAAMMVTIGSGFCFPEISFPGNFPKEDREINDVSREMLEQVNEVRRSRGLSELSLSEELTEVAQMKAEDMRDQGYFSHTSPTYGSTFAMLKEFGIRYKTAGENIAKGQRTMVQVMEDWMDSSGHKANILNETYTMLGVGYCTDQTGTGYWVQFFISE